MPDEPGLGVKLDRLKVGEYVQYFKQHGEYTYDRDPGRIGWFPLVPNTRWADPSVDATPSVL